MVKEHRVAEAHGGEVRTGGCAADAAQGEGATADDFCLARAERGELHEPKVFAGILRILKHIHINSVTMCDRSSGSATADPVSFKASIITAPQVVTFVCVHEFEL